MAIKRIKNLTAVEQSIFVNNRRIVLEPRAEKDFESEVAVEILRVCEGLVEEVIETTEIGAVVMDTVDTGLVWLANMTGNPDAPAAIKRKKRLPRGEWEWTDMQNPLAEAIDVFRELDGGMREYDTADGLMADNLGKTEIRVPKFSRKPLPKDVAAWMLQRDANSGWISPYHRGRIKVSRPKSNFEPDLQWDLDDMRCYLQMIDRGANLGPSEDTVLREAEASGADLVDAVREAKILCMKRLHFRLADPQYRLIGKSEYEAYRAGFEKAKAPISQASAPSLSV